MFTEMSLNFYHLTNIGGFCALAVGLQVVDVARSAADLIASCKLLVFSGCAGLGVARAGFR